MAATSDLLFPRPLLGVRKELNGAESISRSGGGVGLDPRKEEEEEFRPIFSVFPAERVEVRT